jgi:hypothetical protein
MVVVTLTRRFATCQVEAIVTGGGGRPVIYFWKVTSPSEADTSALEVRLRVAPVACFAPFIEYKSARTCCLAVIFNPLVPG